MSNSSTPIPLDYATTRRRRWLTFRRGVILMLIVFVGIGWKYKDDAARPFLRQYWFEQCMKYDSRADAQFGQAPGSIETSNQHLMCAFSYVNPYWPNCLLQLTEVDSRIGPVLWRRELSFVGKLQRPDGNDRLVIISGVRQDASELLKYTELSVLDRPGLFGDGSIVVGTGVRTTQSRPEHVAFLLPARRDPANPSRLLIDFDVYENVGSEVFRLTRAGSQQSKENPTALGRGTIEACLQDDDRFQLRLIDRVVDKLPQGTIQLARMND